MINTALIFVPHPDDEISISYGILDCLRKANIEVSVVCCTNGDYCPALASTRFDEAILAKKILGYDKLIYLGYGDNYKGSHIFNLKDGGTAVSASNRKETYHPKSNENEYCFLRHGVHHVYTRNNYKSDIKEIIVEFKADLLICVDLDDHPDHRCLSILFDEALGEILRDDRNYKPVILKRFAYLGTWHGPEDYFSSTIQETKPVIFNKVVSAYPYLWEDRIIVKNPSSVTPLMFWKSPVFKSLLCYKTQSTLFNIKYCGLLSFSRIVNADMVFWERRSDNIALEAEVCVSSGEGHLLNDFKIYDTKDIRTNNLLIDGLYWTPSEFDEERKVSFSFVQPQTVSLIKIYQNPEFSVKRLGIDFGDGVEQFDVQPGQVLSVETKREIPTSSMSICFSDSYGDTIKISEIELFSNTASPASVLDDVFCNTEASSFDRQRRCRAICLVQKNLYRILCRMKIYGNRRNVRKLYKKQ